MTERRPHSKPKTDRYDTFVDLEPLWQIEVRNAAAREHASRAGDFSDKTGEVPVVESPKTTLGSGAVGETVDIVPVTDTKTHPTT